MRRESANSRRSNEARKKTANSRDTSNRASIGYNRSKHRGKEESVAEELQRNKPEDTDQDQGVVEVIADTRKSREIEERREPLQAKFLLDTFKRIPDWTHRDLRDHTESLRKDPENYKYQALIAQDHLAIQAMEDSIKKVRGDNR